MYTTTPPDRRRGGRLTAPITVRQTRIRIIDPANDEHIATIWTHPDTDDDHIRTLIPDGYTAMVARNVTP